MWLAARYLGAEPGSSMIGSRRRQLSFIRWKQTLLIPNTNDVATESRKAIFNLDLNFLPWSRMFGLIISGRPVDATPQQITEAQYAFRIQPSPSFHHIVVFILPGTQLPPGTAATVYVQIPPSQDFKLLGGIGPGKESAIFRVIGLESGASTIASDGDVMADDSAPASVAAGEIVVGISIEPAAQVESQLASLKNNQTQPSDPSTAVVRLNQGTMGRVTTKVLAQRIVGNAFNFLASFGSDTVPLKAFQDWWMKFEKKIELDPSFLERDEQG